MLPRKINFFDIVADSGVEELRAAEDYFKLLNDPAFPACGFRQLRIIMDVLPNEASAFQWMRQSVYGLFLFLLKCAEQLIPEIIGDADVLEIKTGCYI